MARIGQDPARSLLTLEVFENRERVLTPAEEAQLTTQTIASLRQYEVIWRQVELGLLDRGALDYFGFDPSQVVFLRTWPGARSLMSPDFRDFLEASADAP